MSYAFRVDSKAILPSQKIKLNNTANISTSTVRLKVTFTDTIQSLLSYSQALEKDLAVIFVNLCILDDDEEAKCVLASWDAW